MSRCSANSYSLPPDLLFSVDRVCRPTKIYRWPPGCCWGGAVSGFSAPRWQGKHVTRAPPAGFPPTGASRWVTAGPLSRGLLADGGELLVHVGHHLQHEPRGLLVRLLV